MNRVITILILLSWLITGCGPSKKFTQNYHNNNQATIRSILQLYKNIYAVRPFSLGFKDKTQRRIGIEIHTDTIKYIYNFNLDEPFFQDTLVKYNFDTTEMNQLINDMQKVHCTWISNLDYYEKFQKKYLVFLSARDKKLDGFLRTEKYFTLVFF